MERVRRIVALMAVLAGLAAEVGWGQTQPVTRQPDCQVFFSFTVAASVQQFNNRNWGCSYWIVTYNSQGFATLSLAFQDAPDAAGGVPGAWVNFTGAVVLGINPNTAIAQGTSEFQGYYPWLRVNLTATTGGPGTVVGTAYGWRTGPPTSATVSIPAVVNTNLSQIGGVAVGPANPMYTVGPCTLSAPITVSAAGSTQIVALTAAQSIRICHISLSMQAPVDIKLVQGTGANCAGGPADITGVYSTVLALGLDWSSPLVGTAANALCVNLGAAVTGGGVIRYAKY